jgi:hypothetical protein
MKKFKQMYSFTVDDTFDKIADVVRWTAYNTPDGQMRFLDERVKTTNCSLLVVFSEIEQATKFKLFWHTS